MKRLFICEKPSLAQTVAHYLGSESKKDGYFEAGNDYVAWLQGHILAQKMPEEYNPDLKKYSYDTLPIIPDVWEKEVKPNGNYPMIYKTVTQLLKEVDEVVNVGDPDREGQLLVDEVLELAGNKLPVKRLYINAMDDTTIKRAFEGMVDNATAHNTYLAALGRERTDWLFGINASRKYTLDAGTTIKVGRVKVPMLALVARRNEEIDNFKSVKYYNVRALFRLETSLPFETMWQIPENTEGMDSERRLLDVISARAVVQKITGKTGTVKSVTTEKSTSAPPLPYSLSTLQRAAEPAFGFDPAKTLELAQSLYEKKLTTYPRSDSNYLPESQLADAAVIIENLKLTGVDELKKYADGADSGIKSKAFNTKKVSAHHALIPTMEKIDVNSLPTDEQKLYTLIAKRYLLQFYPVQEFETTKAEIDCEGETFLAHGKVILNNGWKDVDAESSEDNEEDKKQLPALHEGDAITVTIANIIEKNTTPPARFTQSTLIAALTNAHKYVKNPDLRETVKEIKGIGTEATRSTIIKQLIDAGMMIEKTAKKKAELYVSDSVKELLACLPDEVTYPDMTAIMELELDKIDAGKLTLDDYMQGQEEYIRQIIDLPSKFTPIIKKDKYPVCPVCGTGTLYPHEGKFGKFWSCSNYKNGCKASFSDCNGNPVVEKCPVCGKGYLQRRLGAVPDDIFWGCNEYKNNGCKATFCDVKGKPLIKLCPVCKKGYLVKRHGKNGVFFACNNFRECKATFESGKNGLPVLKAKGRK